MSVFNPNIALWLCKAEASEGTAETLTPGTDDLPVMAGSSINENVQHGEVLLDNAIGGEFPAPRTQWRPTATVIVPLYGLGKDNDSKIILPIWMSVILQSFGKIVKTATTEAAAVWTPHISVASLTSGVPATTAAAKTFTLGQYVGGLGDPASGKKLYKVMRGCRVQRATFSFVAGQIATVTFEIVGRGVKPVDATTDITGNDLDGVKADFIVPDALATSYDGTLANSKNFTVVVDTGAQHIESDATADGVSATALGNIRVSGTIDPWYIEQSTKDYYDRILEPIDYTAGAWAKRAISVAANGVYPANRSAASGFGIKPALPAVQLIGGDQKDPVALRMNLQFKNTAAADSANEFSLTIL